MARKIWPSKDPDEVLDYSFDWSPRGLGAEQLVSSTCDVITGGVVVQTHGVDISGSATVTWLNGGAEGERCELLLRAYTATRTLDQTVFIDIRSR